MAVVTLIGASCQRDLFCKESTITLAYHEVQYSVTLGLHPAVTQAANNGLDARYGLFYTLCNPLEHNDSQNQVFLFDDAVVQGTAGP